jgi:hypothetical protein
VRGLGTPAGGDGTAITAGDFAGGFAVAVVWGTFRSTHRSDICGLFALLLLPKDRAPVMPLDEGGALVSFRPLPLDIRKVEPFLRQGEQKGLLGSRTSTHFSS